MITFANWEFSNHVSADMSGDSSFGNRLFMIAGTIGIAVKNGYEYGFPPWNNGRFFVNPLPEKKDQEYKQIFLDWGFNGFDVPDNVSIYGYLQSEKYFIHCKDIIKHYFTLQRMCDPIKDAILIHFRAYHESLKDTLFTFLKREYFINAIAEFPKKRVVVVTDNIPRAKEVIGDEFEFISNSAINDFYLLTQADYLIMSNSSFSAMAAILAGCPTVAPKKWFARGHKESAKDIYCKNWKVI
jgi:hypothetical protein